MKRLTPLNQISANLINHFDVIWWSIRFSAKQCFFIAKRTFIRKNIDVFTAAVLGFLGYTYIRLKPHEYIFWWEILYSNGIILLEIECSIEWHQDRVLYSLEYLKTDAFTLSKTVTWKSFHLIHPNVYITLCTTTCMWFALKGIFSNSIMGSTYILIKCLRHPPCDLYWFIVVLRQRRHRPTVIILRVSPMGNSWSVMPVWPCASFSQNQSWQYLKIDVVTGC